MLAAVVVAVVVAAAAFAAAAAAAAAVAAATAAAALDRMISHGCCFACCPCSATVAAPSRQSMYGYRSANAKTPAKVTTFTPRRDPRKPGPTQRVAPNGHACWCLRGEGSLRPPRCRPPSARCWRC